VSEATSTNETGNTTEGWRGKIGLMDQREMDEFLNGGNLARLAVLDSAGWPYVQPVWYQWEPSEGIFWIVARKKSAWAAFMKRDGRVALTIDGETRPYRKVALQGSAEVIEEPNVGGQWVEIARKMAVRYLGEHGPDYIVPTLDKARWLFKITPTSLVTWQGVDWHPKYKDS
jgi:PPOX class probable F420-dependent enzyme